MQRSALICLFILGFSMLAAANPYGGRGGYQQYQQQEKRSISLPLPTIRLSLDKLSIPLPNLMNLFSMGSHSSHDDDDEDNYYPPPPPPMRPYY